MGFNEIMVTRFKLLCMLGKYCGMINKSFYFCTIFCFIFFNENITKKMRFHNNKKTKISIYMKLKNINNRTKYLFGVQNTFKAEKHHKILKKYQ